MLNQFQLLCPRCSAGNICTVNLGVPEHQVTCGHCRAVFVTHIAKARSRNSRHITEKGERIFSIRVKNFNGTEELIEFVNAGKQNFEFRSGDTVAFTYLKDTLKLVQNFTISQHMFVAPNLGCLMGFFYVYAGGIIILLAVSGILLIFLLFLYVLSWLFGMSPRG